MILPYSFCKNALVLSCVIHPVSNELFVYYLFKCVLGLHDMRKICDHIVECRDNDITCDKWTDIKISAFL